MAIDNKTFWELMNENGIKIPILQRDYAQGRAEESEKRDRFLEVLHDTLVKNKKLNLDFVYGRIVEKIFYPIDGQQRLTTLFLLHWYVALSEEVDDDSKKILANFTYDTRISSREFCQTLIAENTVLKSNLNKSNLEEVIKNQHWFRRNWNNDPTIKAMLTMIQSIHEKFSGSREHSFSLWNQLTKERLITFQILDLGKKGFELTDELYIKMNARGKQLTPFENFKAGFIQFLQTTFPFQKYPHPVKGEISYAEYFSYKIEKEWTDLFWSYRGEKTTFDVEFYNYIEFVAQMCFFKDDKEAKADDFQNNFNQYKNVFKKEENFIFLIQTLDKLYNLGKPQTVFKDIFHSKNQPPITLFWNSNQNEFDLFNGILQKGRNEDVRNKILLYCILNYLINHKLKQNSASLSNYVRVVRNLLQAIRQRNETRYNNNARINDFGNYWVLFSQMATEDIYQTLLDATLQNEDTRISKASFKNEKDKAELIVSDTNLKPIIFQLEEQKCFGGLIHALDPLKNKDNLDKYLKAIEDIWSDEIADTLKIQTLIACGFRGVYIKHCNMGPMFYYGRQNNWTTVMTADRNADIIHQSIQNLLESYQSQASRLSTSEKLQQITQKWLRNYSNKNSLEYYFIKYPDFSSKPLNYYVIPKSSFYDTRMLGSDGRNPLVANHISPFVLTVGKIVAEKEICDLNKSYLQYSGFSPLYLLNGISLLPCQNGWKVDFSSTDDDIKNSLIQNFNLEKIEQDYLLRTPNNKDSVEIAVDFVSYING